jgi:hypothetical protein
MWGSLSRLPVHGWCRSSAIPVPCSSSIFRNQLPSRLTLWCLDELEALQPTPNHSKMPIIRVNPPKNGRKIFHSEGRVPQVPIWMSLYQPCHPNLIPFSTNASACQSIALKPQPTSTKHEKLPLHGPEGPPCYRPDIDHRPPAPQTSIETMKNMGKPSRTNRNESQRRSNGYVIFVTSVLSNLAQTRHYPLCNDCKP